MYKLIGSLSILFATSMAGYLYGVEQQCYLEKLLYIRHIVYMFQGELEYSNAPLGEMFGRVAVRVKNPYQKWLYLMEHEVEQRTENEFFKIWMRNTDVCLKELHLKQEHMIQLKELGTYLGKMDRASESRNLQLYMERMELEIEKVRTGMATKIRIGKCLGIMGGLFLVVILI